MAASAASSPGAASAPSPRPCRRGCGGGSARARPRCAALLSAPLRPSVVAPPSSSRARTSPSALTAAASPGGSVAAAAAGGGPAPRSGRWAGGAPRPQTPSSEFRRWRLGAGSTLSAAAPGPPSRGRRSGASPSAILEKQPPPPPSLLPSRPAQRAAAPPPRPPPPPPGSDLNPARDRAAAHAGARPAEAATTTNRVTWTGRRRASAVRVTWRTAPARPSRGLAVRSRGRAPPGRPRGALRGLRRVTASFPLPGTGGRRPIRRVEGCPGSSRERVSPARVSLANGGAAGPSPVSVLRSGGRTLGFCAAFSGAGCKTQRSRTVLLPAPRCAPQMRCAAGGGAGRAALTSSGVFTLLVADGARRARGCFHVGPSAPLMVDAEVWAVAA